MNLVYIISIMLISILCRTAMEHTIIQNRNKLDRLHTKNVSQKKKKKKLINYGQNIEVQLRIRSKIDQSQKNNELITLNE